MSVVLVTGASRGLGAALAEGFRARGDRVFGTWRVREAEARSHCDAALRMDLGDRDSIRAAVEAVVQESGRIDVLVNNAAITGGGFFGFDDGMDEVLEANLAATAAVTRHAVRQMLVQGGGVILNVSSVAALRPPPGQAAYATAKSGLIGLTRVLARELAPRNIRVNALVPGLLAIGSAARMPSTERDRWLAHVPMGRVGQASEAVEAALWLCSDASRYVVGHALAVDGGMAIR